ncbi:ATP-binding cassette domain-containing protein [Conexibacter arvalis]|uniref:ABC-type multidrug transport system ATPase subunit n=1 Tax=Conexibacter arvalis TaxID=912552 RepID=A0A840I8G1_9ACTN|nr:ATP-binding cassette domain-containing protein [Conexibacter arvalis]MBB4660812.1 ABC-type multidrug transport system ATPase subunit [Conexibacter arvalis]
MTLLELRDVTKRYALGRLERVALRAVSLDVHPGELVAVWGLRRSGRSTLLRVAAGIEQPDEGVVRFDGRDLGGRGPGPLGSALGFCSTRFDQAHGTTVLDHVAIGRIARGAGRNAARSAASGVLERVGAGHCMGFDPRELEPAEAIRAGIARALVTEPRLLVLDEPTSGVDLLERDALLELLRSLADDGIAVLAAVGEAVGGADRMLAIGDGQLRGETVPEHAPVVPLRPRRAEPSA